MASTRRRYSKEEFAHRGDAIYENDVRPLLKGDDEGKFVAIDIESGMHEIDADELAAGDRLRARLPGAQIWVVRVGSRFAHRLGGRNRREAQ
jgi:hypothetical protein